MNFFLIVVSSGKGTRLHKSYPKQFINVAGKTILEHSLRPFVCSNKFSKIIVTLPPFRDEKVIQIEKILKNQSIEFLYGGEERQDSVLNGLQYLKKFAGENDFVFIHDGVRPLISISIINELINNIYEKDCIIPTVPITSTIKNISVGKNTKTIDRNNLFIAQTPQVFNFRKIYNLSQRAKNEGLICTDDASIFEYYGEKVFTIPGSKFNIKITTEEDLELFKKIISTYRIGLGYDVHRLTKNRPLILLGEKIDFDLGLLGHSDADVATHALIDAILGAAGLGDIGEHFPDSDCIYKDISSIKLLEKTYLKIKEIGFLIENVDITIVAEAPKITPFKSQMKKKLAKALFTSEEKINIKAKTNEGLGFEGKSLGISAHAIATLRFN